MGISQRHFCFSGKRGRFSTWSPHSHMATLGWHWGPDAPFSQGQETLGCPPTPTGSPTMRSGATYHSHHCVCITHWPFIMVPALLFFLTEIAPYTHISIKNWKTKVRSLQIRGTGLALGVVCPNSPYLAPAPSAPIYAVLAHVFHRLLHEIA